jgi:beta-lactamase regulating signal transducer with metallopeptidase domain/biopolymer transport protein ExbD
MIDILNEFGARWAAYFTAALVQNTVFLALVFLVLYRFRHISARIRYAVGVVGIVKLILPPFVPVRLWIGTADRLQSAEGFTGVIPFVWSGGSAPAAVRPETQLSVVGLFFAVWIAIVIMYMLASIVSTLRLASSLRRSVPVVDETATQLMNAERIRVYKSDKIAMPLTLGVFPRKIFVPAAWDWWTKECRLMILRHETAHIARRDGLVQTLQIVARALYFFHPLVLVLDRRIAEYREMACDDESVGAGRRTGVEYSRFLVEVAESIVKTPTTCESASALMKKKNELLNRVRYQMKGGVMLSKGRTAVLLAALLLLVLPLSWYSTSAAPERAADGKAKSELAGTGERLHGGQQTPPPPPEAPAQPVAPKRPVGGSITVEVGSEEKVVIDDEAVTWALVKEQLRKIAGDDNKVVRLQCADDTPMEQIHRIHEVLREVGLDRIEYRNSDGYKAPLVLPPADIDERLSEINAIAKADLQVDDSGKLTLDGEPVELSKLTGLVVKRIEKVPPTIVIVQTTKKTLYKDFLGVLAALKEAGAERIVIKEPAGP